MPAALLTSLFDITVLCWVSGVSVKRCRLQIKSDLSDLKQDDVVYLAEPLKFTWATGLGERVREPLSSDDNLCTIR